MTVSSKPHLYEDSVRTLRQLASLHALLLRDPGLTGSLAFTAVFDITADLPLSLILALLEMSSLSFRIADTSPLFNVPGSA